MPVVLTMVSTVVTTPATTMSRTMTATTDAAVASPASASATTTTMTTKTTITSGAATAATAAALRRPASFTYVIHVWAVSAETFSLSSPGDSLWQFPIMILLSAAALLILLEPASTRDPSTHIPLFRRVET